MYSAHLQRGGNFRARWSELPDYPCFDTDARDEVHWRNIWKYSRSEHHRPGGASRKLISEMRNVFVIWKGEFGEEPKLSWIETKSILEDHFKRKRSVA